MEAPLTGAPLESTTFPCTRSPTSCANNDDDEHRLTAIISIPETIAFRSMCPGFAARNLANPGKALKSVLPDQASFVGLWVNFRIWSLVFVRSEIAWGNQRVCAEMARR